MNDKRTRNLIWPYTVVNKFWFVSDVSKDLNFGTFKRFAYIWVTTVFYILANPQTSENRKENAISFGVLTINIKILVPVTFWNKHEKVFRTARTLVHNRTWKHWRFQWPCALRHMSAAARLMRMGVRIPLMAWMFVSWVCCVLCS